MSKETKISLTSGAGISAFTQEVLKFAEAQENNYFTMSEYMDVFANKYLEYKLTSIKQRIHSMKYRGFVERVNKGYQLTALYFKVKEKGLIRVITKGRALPVVNPEPEPERQQQQQLGSDTANAALGSVAKLIRDNHNMLEAIRQIENILSDLKAQTSES